MRLELPFETLEQRDRIAKPMSLDVRLRAQDGGNSVPVYDQLTDAALGLRLRCLLFVAGLFRRAF